MKRKLAAFMTTALATASGAMYFAMSAFAEEAAAAATETPKPANPILTFVIPLGFFFVVLYFMMIRPQKKREQEQKELQSSVQIGDEVVTTGGIVGIVVRVADDTVVIETGGERTKIRMKNWAIAENISAQERAKAAAPKKKAGLASAAVLDETDKKSKKKKDNDEE